MRDEWGSSNNNIIKGNRWRCKIMIIKNKKTKKEDIELMEDIEKVRYRKDRKGCEMEVETCKIE